jgi:hypothetical protein
MAPLLWAGLPEPTSACTFMDGPCRYSARTLATLRRPAVTPPLHNDKETHISAMWMQYGRLIRTLTGGKGDCIRQLEELRTPDTLARAIRFGPAAPSNRTCVGVHCRPL